MAVELILKFVLGGVIVSLFSVLGEVFKPKTFSGIFGAAPSVALASLALAFHKNGADYVSAEGRSMMIGALAFYVYGAACVAATKREHWPVWLSAAASWAAWLAVALAIFGAGEATGILR